MIKSAGIAVIIITSFAAAYRNTKLYKRRIGFCEGMLELIRFIRSRILYFHDPLDEIYSDFDNELLRSSGFIDELKGLGFSKSVDSPGISRYFGENTLYKLRAFGDKLGKTPADEQVANCDLCISILESEAERLRADLPKKSRMYSSLYILCGLGAVLLLI